MNSFSRRVSTQRGFTLIELLVTLAILSILAGLSWVGFVVYKENAEYQKAESDLRNAQTAAEAGILALASGYPSVGLTFSGSDGGPVPAAVSDVLPGAVVSYGVNLGVEYTQCAAQDMTPQVYLVATPCQADRYATFTKFCNGTEIKNTDLAGGAC